MKTHYRHLTPNRRVKPNYITGFRNCDQEANVKSSTLIEKYFTSTYFNLHIVKL